MTVRSNGPNSNADIDKFSQSLEDILGKVGNRNVKDVLNRLVGSKVEKKLDKGGTLLREMIEKIDKPILKGMAMDTITVLSNFFEDPTVLCCLVQGVWANYASSHDNAKLAQLKGNTIADTDFVKYLDMLIAFIDLIIVFLGSDIKKISLFIPDFIKEIMNAVVGAILLVLQETLFSLRDTAMNRILEEIDNSLDNNSIWANCLPLQQFLSILKKYVHDYGLFADMFEKIKGFIAGKVGDFGAMKKLDFPKNIKDLEFLYWFRDLLLKLRQATLNFDLCVNYGFSPTGGLVDTAPGVSPTGAGGVLGAAGEGSGYPDPSSAQGIKVAADGTILQDKESVRQNSIPVLANSSIRTFLNKYYGYPLDVVDNILTGSSSADSIQGTNINSDNVSDLNADCPGSPRPEDIVRWALRVRNRNV